MTTGSTRDDGDQPTGPVIYLSIGANGDDPEGAVAMAVLNILSGKGIIPVGLGSFYESEPQGKKDQPWFVNTALAIQAPFTPAQTLDKMKDIEKKMGRVPTQRWGRRRIDIDIIFFGDTRMNTPQLTIPHPLAALRRFVLKPLADINPELVHPVLGKTVSELLRAIPKKGQRVRKLMSEK